MRVSWVIGLEGFILRTIDQLCIVGSGCFRTNLKDKMVKWKVFRDLLFPSMTFELPHWFFVLVHCNPPTSRIFGWKLSDKVKSTTARERRFESVGIRSHCGKQLRIFHVRFGKLTKPMKRDY